MRPKISYYIRIALVGIGFMLLSKIEASRDKTVHLSPIFETPAAVVKISGKIVSEANEPLIGANVLVKGTTIGAVTDVDGMYSLEAPSTEGTLVISYTGYETMEIAIAGRTTVDITLKEDQKILDEVVVVGYGIVKKSDVTGSVASIDQKKLEAVPVQNLTQAMQGRAAGVDIVQNSARPGAFPQIRIRGSRSLNATNNPLFVMDGIPLSEGTSINDFNPNDVQSIEILKDASATAIYGARGANGVILVTTKKGKKGKARISYDGYYGLAEPLAPVQMMSGAEFAEYRRDAYRNNSNVNDYTTPFPNPAQDFNLFRQDINMWESVAQAYEWEDKDKLIPKYRPATAEEKARFANWGFGNFDQVPIYDPSKVRNTDWASLVLQTGRKQNHQLNISGGSDNLSVVFSMGYYDEDGIQKGQGYQRISSRLGVDYQVNNFLKIGSSINTAFIEQDWGTDLYGNAVGQLPLAVPYNADGTIIYSPGADPLIFTPLGSIEGEIEDRDVKRIFGSLYAEIDILKGLRFRTNFGPDFMQYRRGIYQDAFTRARNGGTTFGQYDNTQRFNYVLENLLYYDKSLGKNHTLGVTLLQSTQQNRDESSSLSVQELPYSSQLFYNLGSTNATGPTGFGSGYSLVKIASFMGRVNLNLSNKYLFTVTGRYDGSSVLAEGNKWEFFPSFAAAWKIHEEGFLKNGNFFNELKLRAGYGRTGNSAVGPYSTQGGLTKTRYAWNDAAAWGFVPNLIPNPDLKWETTGQIDIGIDFRFLNDRISGTIDVYQANTSDLIMDRQIPTASGFASIQANIGATRNTGIEVSLSTINLDTRGFRWNSDIIFSKNKEEITELYNGKADDLGNRWFIGQPIIAYYDFKPTGVWTLAEAAQAAEYGSKPGLGKFLDINGDKKIDATNDRLIVGSNVPDFTASLNNTFSYKGLELSFLIFARVGQTLVNGFYRPALAGRYTETQYVAQQYWTPDRENVVYPKANQDQERPLNPESYMYQDGSFVKVRTVSLTYALPANLTSKLHLSNLSFYATAFNPFLFTKFKITDPEFISSSRNFNDQIQGLNLTEKAIIFGVKLGL